MFGFVNLLSFWQFRRQVATRRGGIAKNCQNLKFLSPTGIRQSWPSQVWRDRRGRGRGGWKGGGADAVAEFYPPTAIDLRNMTWRERELPIGEG
ncbi:unnamed protein product, partial [Nesidiocoris tenuis]